MYVNFALKATPVQDITVANTCATCFFFIATNTRKKSFTAPIVYAIATRATAMTGTRKLSRVKRNQLVTV